MNRCYILIFFLSGQILEGTLKCQKHAKDPRALEVQLEITSSENGAVVVKQDFVLE